MRIVELPTIRLLVEHGRVVVCAGGGVDAAADFVRATGRDAVIGALADLPLVLAGTSGTLRPSVMRRR